MSARLLLVDDEPGLREAVQAYLEDSDFAVEVASNAREKCACILAQAFIRTAKCDRFFLL